MTPSAPTARLSLALLMGLGLVVFLANAGLLVLQLLAGRYLAPFIGSSVETWTAVIGAFLTGIALGNHVGGRLADRSPTTRTLGLLLLAGAACSLSLMAGGVICDQTGVDKAIPLGPRIPILAALFCLPPAFALSLMTPLTIKLMLSDVTKAGRVSGLVFAVSTLGCLLGNYATGFWLMADYTLDAISVGVAIGLAVLAVPMLVINVRAPAASVPVIRSNSAVLAADDPLGFRSDIRRAFVVVFLASFCGMSLELTASRILAPALGVSIYMWTGVIGVMLAGTACGNYLGGVMADRGLGAALVRVAYVLGPLVGFAAGPALVRSFRIDDFPAEGGVESWVLRIVGAAVALGIVVVRVRARGTARGRLINLVGIGAAVGFAAAHAVAQSLANSLGWGDLREAFADANVAAGFNVGAIPVHLLGAMVGALIAWGLAYEPERTAAPAQSPLTACLFCAALFTGLVVLLKGVFQNEKLGVFLVVTGYDLIWNVLTWSFLLFFLPMLCLGTVSPQVIKMSVRDAAGAGRVAGSVYAWSTVGAIAGTFATGYFLIGWVGMNRTVFAIVLVLLGLTFVVGRLWKNTSMLFAASIVFGGAITGLAFTGFGAGSYDRESKYYAIRVRTAKDAEGHEEKTLVLDLLIHSRVRPADPTWLGYPHENIQGELVRNARHKGPANVLVIGGGAYTFPRWVEATFPDVGIDVVEIDPGVTAIAQQEFGLKTDSRIRTYNMDGRQFVRETADQGRYTYVFQDAVNDLSVPYHLMTKEYNDAVKGTLAPRGAYVLTLIDSLSNGRLWRAAIHTLKQTFKHVEVLDPDGFTGRPEERRVYMIYAADEPFDVADVRAVAEEYYARNALLADNLVRRSSWTHALGQERLNIYLRGHPPLILTDQYAPVDNLMGDVFRARAREKH